MWFLAIFLGRKKKKKKTNKGRGKKVVEHGTTVQSGVALIDSLQHLRKALRRDENAPS